MVMTALLVSAYFLRWIIVLGIIFLIALLLSMSGWRAEDKKTLTLKEESKKRHRELSAELEAKEKSLTELKTSQEEIKELTKKLTSEKIFYKELQEKFEELKEQNKELEEALTSQHTLYQKLKAEHEKVRSASVDSKLTEKPSEETLPPQLEA